MGSDSLSTLGRAADGLADCDTGVANDNWDESLRTTGYESRNVDVTSQRDRRPLTVSQAWGKTKTPPALTKLAELNSRSIGCMSPNLDNLKIERDIAELDEIIRQWQETFGTSPCV